MEKCSLKNKIIQKGVGFKERVRDLAITVLMLAVVMEFLNYRHDQH